MAGLRHLEKQNQKILIIGHGQMNQAMLSEGCKPKSINGKGFINSTLMANTEIRPFYVDRDGTFVDAQNWTIKGFILNEVLGHDTFLAPKGSLFTSINRRQYEEPEPEIEERNETESTELPEIKVFEKSPL